MSTTPDLGIPELAQAQATPEITHNEALVLIQALQNGVIDKDLSAPPGSPTEGDSYIVASGGSGDWNGWDDHIAVYWGGSWRFVPGFDDGGSIITMGARQVGLSVYVRDETVQYTWAAQGTSPETYAWTITGGSALGITYDNSASGLTATNVQAAIDEVEGRVDDVEAKTDILWENGSSVASATSLDLSGLDGDEIEVSGTATITEITGLSVGQEVTLRATAAWTLEHDGTDIDIPRDDDFIASAGDMVRIRCYQTDDVRVLWVTRADGNPLNYEEGTWTPEIDNTTPGDLSVSYSTQTGSYTRLGNFVDALFSAISSSFTWSSASGNWILGGLPFTVVDQDGTGVFSNAAGYSLSTEIGIQPTPKQGTNYGRLEEVRTSGFGPLGLSQLPSGNPAGFSGAMRFEI